MIEDHISDTDIAIIGMAGRYPKANNLVEFWRKLCASEEFATFLTEDDMRAWGAAEEQINDPSYVRASGMLEDTERFDAGFFGYNPKEAGFMDPQHRHFLEVAWEAMEDAGYDADKFDGRVGVYGGVAMDTYALLNIATNPHLMTYPNKVLIQVGNDNSYVATRVAYRLNLKGPSITLQCACSTSLVATHLACQSLLIGECDMAMVGGSTVHAQGKTGYQYLKGGVASPDGRCRTFDAQGQGPIFNSGVGVVVLKRLKEARADRDHIYAIIKGSAVNNDGSLKVSYAAPSVAGQAAVIAEALANAAVPAETINYIEAHGTATPLGDPIEIKALTQVYRAETDKKQFCAIGSVKSNVGHLDAAAGVTGLIKTTLALQNKLIPASLHFDTPNPQIDFENSPFRVITKPTEWPAGPTPRRAGVSAFGIGGTNAHLILQEAPPAQPGSESRPIQLIAVSARSSAALEKATTHLAEHLRQNPVLNLADVAYTLHLGRKSFDQRRIILGRDSGEIAQAIESSDPRRVLTGQRKEVERPVVFMFSGQGAQYPHMAMELYASEPTFRKIIDDCCERLKPHLGLDLRTILLPQATELEKAEEQLKQTWLTQPALFVTEYALAKLWMEWGVRPQAMIGHSIGEYVAACLAGVFTLEDALTLVAARGRLMQSLPPGAMLAVPLAEADVQPFLTSELSIAAINESARCVVSGPEGAIQALEKQLSEKGFDGRRLHTSHAFHSAMMDPILESFTQQLQNLTRQAPAIPFISNVTGDWITDAQATDPAYWATHLRQGVRFADGLTLLLTDPNRVFIEVGPGQTLTTLARRHPHKTESHLCLASLRHPQDKGPNLEFLLSNLGQLWLAGVEIDWPGFYTHEQRSRVSLPTYPFERQRFWIEPGNPEAYLANDPQSSLAKKKDITDWFYLPSWKRTMPPVATTTETRPWLLFSDSCGLGSQIANRLTQNGDEVITVRVGAAFTQLSDQAYTLNPEHSGDYETLFKTLAERGQLPGRLVHLWSVTAESENTNAVAQAEAFQHLGFYSLLYLTQAWARHASQAKAQIRVLSNNMQPVANEPVLYPAKATLLGPCKVIPQENKHLTCQSIDLVLPEAGGWAEAQLLDQLVAELYADPTDPVLAYRGYSRWVQTYEPVPLKSLTATPPSSRLREGGVYLITGGLGGLGLQLAEYLARTVKAKLVLIGRSALPPQAEWDHWLASDEAQATDQRDKIEKVKALEALGAEVLVLSADVTDQDQMQAVISQVKARWGAVQGVLHTAGVPGGGIIQLKLRPAAEKVLAPKIQGTLVLNEVLKHEKCLDFIYLFSSITAVAGGFGQVDYCGANAFLDVFAQANTAGRTVPTVSINWDAWQKVGMAANTQALRALPTLPSGEPVGHPLLERYRRESTDKATFITEFSAAKHWVLSEHRVVGIPTIPGSTYPEIAYAAFVHHTGVKVVELRDLLFIKPFMAAENASKEMLVTLEQKGEAYEFHALSQAGSGNGSGPQWQDHVTGQVRALENSTPPTRDLAAILQRCAVVDVQAVRGQAGMAEFVDTGPRWECIREVYAGNNEGLAVLELAEAFAGDVEQHELHPTLMDIATAFAIQSLGQGNYLPLAYKQVRVYAPLPSKVYCYVRVPESETTHKETVMIDVAIMTEAGESLVEIEGFAVKRVSPEAVVRLAEAAKLELRATATPKAESAHAGGAAGTLRNLQDGILPEEGIEAFARIVAWNRFPQIIVSTRNLPEALAEINAFDPQSFIDRVKSLPTSKTQKYPRPDLAGPYVAPRSESEQRIAGLWQEVLGIEQVGIHDNFFELGGDSMLGTQIMARAKEAGIEMTPAQFFQHQTIAELAVLLDELLSQPGSEAQVVQPTTMMEEERLLANLDQLSEEEMDALLAKMETEGSNNV